MYKRIKDLTVIDFGLVQHISVVRKPQNNQNID